MDVHSDLSRMLTYVCPRPHLPFARAMRESRDASGATALDYAVQHEQRAAALLLRRTKTKTKAQTKVASMKRP